MRSHMKQATDFANKVKKTKDILQIILFGSVAIGQDTVESDIDIAIVHRSKDHFALMKEINKKKTDKIQTTFIHIDKLSEETELVGALSGEGILLYGRPIIIKEKKLDLQAKVLISYSLTALPQTEKVKVNRALYGSTSKVKIKGKEYKTETKGLINEPGIEKINRGVLLVQRRKAAKVLAMLKRFKVQCKELPLWTY
jgi:predicted nucleotidyltransferase